MFDPMCRGADLPLLQFFASCAKTVRSKITIFCDFSYIRIPHLKKFFWVEIFFWVCPNCASENFLIFFSHPTLKNYNSTTASGKIFMLFIHNHKYFGHNIIYFGSFSLIASAPTAPATGRTGRARSTKFLTVPNLPPYIKKIKRSRV